jgi:hypothetical protein
MTRRWLPGALALVLACGAAAPAQDTAARTDAASMQRKLVAIVDRAERAAPAPAAPALRTSFTDREVNAYFRLHGPEFLPEGVIEPQVTIDRAGRVRARAIVDLDQALKPKERSWLDPLAWVGGKVEVTGAGVLAASNGRGVFTLETATLGGVTVPKTLLQELVTYYSKSPDMPGGFQLDQPFVLPSAIKAVETSPGRATIVQ